MRLLPALVLSVSLFPFHSTAQVIEHPALEGPPGATFRVGTFEEPFRDPGNETAKALAAMEGVSIGEATRRLRIHHSASLLQYRLERKYPDTFAGVVVAPGTSRVVVRFARTDPAVGEQRVRQEISDAELLGAVVTEQVARSRRENLASGAALLRSTSQVSPKATVAVDPSTGHTKILVPDPQGVRSAIEEGRLIVPEGTSIEQFSGMILTADIHAGRAYNPDNFLGCTSGFVVLHQQTNEVGVTTAAHCANRGEYAFNFSTDYNSAGTTLTWKGEWHGPRPSDNYGQDIQWHNASYATNSFPAKFWDGTQYFYVTGYQNSAPGTIVCKYGRTTLRSCGPVDQYIYSDSTTYADSGWYSRANVTATSGRMSEEGDSGGPVYAGSSAVGFVHARDSNYNLYYMPLGALSETDIRVVICTTC